MRKPRFIQLTSELSFYSECTSRTLWTMHSVLKCWILYLHTLCFRLKVRMTLANAFSWHSAVWKAHVIHPRDTFPSWFNGGTSFYHIKAVSQRERFPNPQDLIHRSMSLCAVWKASIFQTNCCFLGLRWMKASCTATLKIDQDFVITLYIPTQCVRLMTHKGNHSKMIYAFQLLLSLYLKISTWTES